MDLCGYQPYINSESRHNQINNIFNLGEVKEKEADEDWSDYRKAIV